MATIAPLQRVQNATARLIMNCGPCDHVASTLKQLHWLLVHRRIQFKLCSIMHSIHVCQSPVYLANLVQGLTVHQRRPGQRSGDSMEYWLPRCHSELGECAFFFTGPLVWNKACASWHFWSETDSDFMALYKWFYLFTYLLTYFKLLMTFYKLFLPDAVERFPEIVGRCGVLGSRLAFGFIGHGFKHRLFSHHLASAFSKLRSLVKCSLDDSVRRLL